MAIQSWLLAGLAAVDLGLLAGFYFQLRGLPPYDKRTLSVVGAGLAGFVFHAFLFFEGPFLILQLATIAGIFGLCCLNQAGRQSKGVD